MKVSSHAVFEWFARTSIVLILAVSSYTRAQQTGQTVEMNHATASVQSKQLAVRGLDGKSVTFTLADLAMLPHKTISVYNEHTKTNERYSGVELIELLQKVGTPQGESVKGKLFMTAVVAEGADHYCVIYTLAEVDPSIHTGDVLVADSIEGHPLDKDGAFKMVSTEERRPARWVRNLAQISVINVKP
ncbi:molybdopterin-dependent oxidoreductase [Telmatobacter sp. DSM 110680]|uniref:Molybdopterin-dependent oxidoreductase n=1 Tax=Telmatobacter sp. DSM 110680 TaxID=3036704 RepID=A0AAU7DDV9_9BACT